MEAITGEIIEPKSLKGFDVTYTEGKLEIQAGMGLEIDSSIEGVLIRRKGMMIGGYIWFHLAFPFEGIKDANGKQIIFGNMIIPVDYYIEHCASNEFSELHIAFPELNYFLPSHLLLKWDTDPMTVNKKPQKVSEFSFLFQRRKVDFLLQSVANFSLKPSAGANIETYNEIILKFSQTGNMKFIIGLLNIIYSLFSFLYNRTNIHIEETVLIGTDEPSSRHKLHYVNMRLPIKDDDEKSMRKAPNFNLLKNHFEKLFMLFVKSKVACGALPSSEKDKSLYDLKRALSLTSIFELNRVELLPEIPVSEERKIAYANSKSSIELLANKAQGKIKKIYKEIAKSLNNPFVSLEQSIIKVYEGYIGWGKLTNVFNADGGITPSAQTVAKFRNALVHGKEIPKPGKSFFNGFKTLEKINFCIVYRKAGYSDKTIKQILEIMQI